jgi:hypothetical protein
VFQLSHNDAGFFFWNLRFETNGTGEEVVLKKILTHSLRKQRSSPPKKRTVQPRDTFDDTAFKPGFEIVKF